ILPAAYMRSSTSTVRGRKSTSRRLPTVAVLRTSVSPWRTTTAPEACLAIFPVSKVISDPAISTATEVPASDICSGPFLRPAFGRRAFVLLLISESEPGQDTESDRAATIRRKSDRALACRRPAPVYSRLQLTHQPRPMGVQHVSNHRGLCGHS